MRWSKRIRWRVGFARVVRAQVRTGRKPAVPLLYIVAATGVVACATGGGSTTSVPTPQQQSCPAASVPLTAGLAAFVDSAVLDPQQLGTRYRYRGADSAGLRDLLVDVFIYPAAGWSPPARQAAMFVETLDTLKQQGRIAGFDVLATEKLALRVGAGGTESEVVGHSVRIQLSPRSNDVRESYFAVFPEADRYVKFRATYPPSPSTRDAVGNVVFQVLAARAARQARCQS
jgi:hypothetical protein